MVPEVVLLQMVLVLEVGWEPAVSVVAPAWVGVPVVSVVAPARVEGALRRQLQLFLFQLC
ncbi:MAG: hypothetical protein NZ821_08365 [Gloeomargarita sp. SKYB31]|nr:hypothetical protein [Gloeomargarita sp. SKYB31]